MVGSGVGARHGILFKTAAALESAGRTRIVVLDKTGTVTKGKPEVTDIIPAENSNETELLTLAASLESKSEHPLADAVMKYSETKKIFPEAVSNFAALAGNGLSAKRNGRFVCGGHLNYIADHAPVGKDMKLAAERLAEQGKTPLFFAEEGNFLGIIAVADVIKEESPQAVGNSLIWECASLCLPETMKKPRARWQIRSASMR